MKKPKFKYALSIDPSINACGYAVHNIKTKKLLDHGLISPKKAIKKKEAMPSFIDKSRYVLDTIQDVMDSYEDNSVQLVLEIPDHWGDQGYLARESGSIYKLTFVCGMICSLSEHIVTYLPREWKGQMKKEVMQRRLARFCKGVIDIKSLNHNVVDAIGIGRKFLGEKV